MAKKETPDHWDTYRPLPQRTEAMVAKAHKLGVMGLCVRCHEPITEHTVKAGSCSHCSLAMDEPNLKVWPLGEMQPQSHRIPLGPDQTIEKGAGGSRNSTLLFWLLIVLLCLNVALGVALSTFTSGRSELVEKVNSIDHRLERIQVEYDKWKVHHELLWEDSLRKYDPEKRRAEDLRKLKEDGK